MEGVSYSDVAAMVKGNNCCDGMNNWMNNPFMYLIWLAYMGNGAFGFGNRGCAGQGLQDAEIMSQLNAIRNTMADNQNASTIGAGISGNHEMLHNLAAQICNASTTNLMSQKDMAAQMASCCCDIKSSILGQTTQLQSQIAGLGAGMTQGFAQIGYAMSQQTNELANNANMNTQRIIDRMCAAETQDLRDRLAQASQNAQTATLISVLKPTAAAATAAAATGA